MGFSFRWLLLLQSMGSGAQAQQLWWTGLVTPWHVWFSCVRDRIRVSCIGRQIHYHWATREAPMQCLYNLSYRKSALLVFKSFSEIVVLHTVVVLVCLWKEMSSGSPAQLSCFPNIHSWDFPGSLVVKTLPSTSIPGWGIKIPQASWPKNQNIKKKRNNIVTNPIKTLKMTKLKKLKIYIHF